jgi:hypothetical protein
MLAHCHCERPTGTRLPAEVAAFAEMLRAGTYSGAQAW